MRLWLLPLLAATTGLGACAVPTSDPGEDPSDRTVDYDEPFTSDVATLLDFEFDGELTSSTAGNTKGQIRAQMLYTVGHLNAEPGVARLDKLVTSGVTVTSIAGPE